MAIFTPTIAASNSINPIHIQFKTFDFELKRDNMVPVVPCPIKIKGKNFIKSCWCWNLIKGLAPSISLGFYSKTGRGGASNLVSEPGDLEFKPRPRIFRCT
jgi:hypothetical protein